jgi:predicted N-acyltransferase
MSWLPLYLKMTQPPNAKEEDEPPYVPHSEGDYVFDSECRSYHLEELN